METIDNEVRGVLNVVEACANTPSVTKLVLTSCLSTILWDRENYSETGAILDEKNWTDLDFCRKQKVIMNWDMLDSFTFTMRDLYFALIVFLCVFYTRTHTL